MQFIYLWIREFRNISKQEFNFSPVYSVHLEHNKLHIEANTKNINIFEDKNSHLSNLTAIVGSNGSGKSSLMEFIWLIGKYNYNKDYITVFYDEIKRIFYVYNNDGMLKDLSVNNHVEGIEENYDPEKMYNIFQTLPIRYNECFTIADYYNFKTDDLRNNADYSMINRVVKSIYNSKSNESNKGIEYITDYFRDDISRQLKNLNNISVNRKSALYDKVRYIEIYLVDHFYNLKLWENSNYEDWKKILSNISRLKDDIKAKNKGINRTKIFESVTYILIDYLISSKRFENMKYQLSLADDIVKEWNRIDISGEMNVSVINNLIEIYANHINLQEVTKQCEKFQKCMEYIFGAFEKNKCVFPIRVPLNNEDSRNEFIKFYQIYNDISFMKRNEMLSFQWPMSSGEYALFNMYCCIMEVVDKCVAENQDCNSILLLLDEVNLYIHPEWQREYICRLISILNECKHNVSFQVILASHSPIILSDIPSQNVIYMTKGENVTSDRIKNNSRTFAQNIYTLYTDSFFLGKNNNIWIHGIFADEKLKEISTYLNAAMTEDKNPDDFKDKMKHYRVVIDMIGEDLIRNELLRKWHLVNSKFTNNSDSILEILDKIKSSQLLNEDEKKVLSDTLGIRG